MTTMTPMPARVGTVAMSRPAAAMLQILLLCLALTCAMAQQARAQVPEQGQYASHGMPDATPGEVYLKYVQVLHAADSANDIMTFSPRTRAENRKQLEAMSDAQRRKALAAMQGMALTDATILSEQVDGDAATLEVYGQSPNLLTGAAEPTWGTVTLVRRGGEWKVANQALRDSEQATVD